MMAVSMAGLRFLGIVPETSLDLCKRSSAGQAGWSFWRGICANFLQQGHYRGKEPVMIRGAMAGAKGAGQKQVGKPMDQRPDLGFNHHRIGILGHKRRAVSRRTP